MKTIPENIKNKSREIYRFALDRGLVKKGRCEVCGTNERIEGHHENYLVPLDVVWFCKTHHMELHAARRHKNTIYGKLCSRKDEVINFVKEGKSIKDIAYLMEVSYSCLHKFANKQGIKLNLFYK